VSKQSDHLQLLADVAAAAADFGAAADAVDEAVAVALGVNRTDLRILGAIYRGGRLTAGEAARAATLSPAATSTAIQRLVAAGLVRRGPDPADRRRATLTLTVHAHGVIEDSYEPIGREGEAELGRWSPAELAVILRFLRDGTGFQHRHADRIREAPHSMRAHDQATH
jgi:DNA-binding MarR family transcriptional regulator